MKIETVPVYPICSSRNHKIFTVLDHRELRLCLGCNHIFARRFNRQQIQKNYTENYHNSEKSMPDWNAKNNDDWEGLCKSIKNI